MENRLCLKSKQREDRTDQEETTDASSHIRHSVAIPYPVPQKNLTVQVNKISIIAKQCFAAVRFILQWNRLFVCAPLYNIVTQGWYFDWQFAPSKLLFKFLFAAWANYFFPLWNRGNVACHRSQLNIPVWKTVFSGSKLKFESQLARSKLPIKIPTLRDNIAKWRKNEQPVSL